MFWILGIGHHVTGDLVGKSDDSPVMIPQPTKAKEQSGDPRETLGSSTGVILIIGSQLFGCCF